MAIPSLLGPNQAEIMSSFVLFSRPAITLFLSKWAGQDSNDVKNAFKQLL